MISFPNCKINLGLHVLDKRIDGYHNIETIFYPISFYDGLEIVEASRGSTENSLYISGQKLQVENLDNLCIKACLLLQKDFDLPFVNIHLHKIIPTGSGLGGGSSDGSATLMLLNKKFNLNIKEDNLLNYALHLGSDCPFFIINRPCAATGRGEKLERLDIQLDAYKIILVYPGFPVATSDAFAGIQPSPAKSNLQKLVQLPVEIWKDNLVNDFEKTVFFKHPVLKSIKEKLYQEGAVYASMTGTGSTVYGLFPLELSNKLQFPEGYLVQYV